MKDAYKYVEDMDVCLSTIFSEASFGRRSLVHGRYNEVTKVSHRKRGHAYFKYAIRHVAPDGRQVFFGGDDEELFANVDEERVA